MKKTIFIFFTSLLLARENPFLPAKELNEDIMVTNVKESYPPFLGRVFELDKNAMILNEVLFKYRLNDGTQSEASFSINESLAPNDGLRLEYFKPDEIDKINSLTKELESLRQALDEALASQKELKKAQATAQAKPQPSPDENIKPKPKPLLRFKNIAIDLNGDKIFINPQAKLVRHFVWDNKIVLDFSPALAQFKSYTMQLLSSLKTDISTIAIGYHKDFFRVVFKLKKPIKYSIKELNGGYELSLGK